MHSDQATIRTRYRRMGDYLQTTSIVYDPVMMTEPYVRSTMMWVLDPALPMSPYPCEEATETALARGHVPHFLPARVRFPASTRTSRIDLARRTSRGSAVRRRCIRNTSRR
jgi:hypothetical protein